jgi:hypothetical protein
MDSRALTLVSRASTRGSSWTWVVVPPRLRQPVAARSSNPRHIADVRNNDRQRIASSRASHENGDLSPSEMRRDDPLAARAGQDEMGCGAARSGVLLSPSLRNLPECEGVLVFYEDAFAGDDRVGVGSALGDLVAGELLEFLARGENGEFAGWNEGEQDAAGVDD